MAASEAQRRAVTKYSKKTTQFVFRFRSVEDADIIARLRDVPCKTGYIRALIRGDINGE